MKQILHHFRISLLLAAALFACSGPKFSASISRNLRQTQNFARYDIESDSAPAKSESANANPEDSAPPKNPDQPAESPADKSPSDKFLFATDLIIKAVNPGYTIDKISNVGEFIELQKLSDKPDFSLAGYGIRYTNSSGNRTLLLNFAEGSVMTGETLLMRYARSPDSDRADATYMTTLAMTTGQVELLYHDEVIDGVCWGSGEDCLPSFKTAQPTSLLRNLETGIFQHSPDYEPLFDPLRPSLVLPPEPAPNPDAPPSENPPDAAPEISAHCSALEFSEILTYYAADKSEQFVEFYNPSDAPVSLDRCALRYKKKTYFLSGVVAPDDYYAYFPTSANFSFTKDPNSSNTLELLDADGAVIDTLVYNHGQKKSTSFARFYASGGEEIWDLTYAPTPGRANAYQEFRTCPAGKIINPETGNCVNVVSGSAAATICPAGKFLNPLTGRCKSLALDSDSPKSCAAGYERNPTTNRCRKIKSDNDGANYALVPNTSSSESTFIAAGVVATIVAFGIFYIILQFRHEIARAARKSVQRINHIFENLIARRVRFHRKKKP